MSDQPRIKNTYVIAGAIAIIAAAWVLSGELFRVGGYEDGGPIAAPTAEDAAAAAAADADLTVVRVRTIKAEPRAADLTLRGQTEAFRKVTLRAETSGVVAAIRADQGTVVKAGDVVCELQVDSRQAMLDGANARMRQAWLEYDAARQLEAKGHRSETQTAAAKAAYEAAQAEAKRMEEELANTFIRAAFDGIVDERAVNVGDYLTTGNACAVLMAEDPFLIVGRVSERDVSLIKAGNAGEAKLITGETVKGTVRFVAKVADPATRTFRVELEVPNPERTLRDGITAELRVAVDQVRAHRIASSILSLDDEGRVGVRIVEDETVRFVPVTIISDGADGAWVTGLPETATVITVGQDYVKAGQRVKAVPEESIVSGEAEQARGETGVQ